MIKIINAIITVVFLFSCSGCESHCQTIRIENLTNETVPDTRFIIKASDLKIIKGKLPVIKDKEGKYVPCQFDDMNGDGTGDELVFVYSLANYGSEELTIDWVEHENYPSFMARTHVRYGKVNSKGKIESLNKDAHDKHNLPRGGNDYPYQHDGPAWENDKIGFRHYFDGRNVNDIYGKTTSSMVLDSVGIGDNGKPANTYQVLDWWGKDILNCGGSFGIGGIGAMVGDKLVRLGVSVLENTDNVDMTTYKLLTTGPVRSVIHLGYYGWQIGNDKINIEQTITIWAGQYGYENVIRTSNLPDKVHLITGIVNNFNTNPYYQQMMNGYYLMGTHDKQTNDKKQILGMALAIDSTNYARVFDAPNEGDLTTTWCAELKPNTLKEYRYNCYAAWELTDTLFKNREYFINHITRSIGQKYKLTILR